MNLPEYTTNSSPEGTAEHQNKFIIDKVSRLVLSLSDPVSPTQKGKNPFKCVLCDSNFSKIEDLKTHVSSIHEGKKPFKCNICDISVLGSDELKEHINATHEDSESDGVTNSNKKKSFSFKFVTAGSVTRIIRKLMNTKATGTDGIQTEVWKISVAVLAGPIALFSTLVLAQEYSQTSSSNQSSILCSKEVGKIHMIPAYIGQSPFFLP